MTNATTTLFGFVVTIVPELTTSEYADLARACKEVDAEDAADELRLAGMHAEYDALCADPNADCAEINTLDHAIECLTAELHSS